MRSDLPAEIAALGPDFDRALLPLVALRLDGRLLTVNRAFGELVQRAAETLRDQPLRALCCRPEDVEAISTLTGSALSGAPAGQVTLELTRPGGEPVSVRLTWACMRGSDGDPSYITALVVDETERVRAEQEQAAIDRRWRALLQHAADVTWLADDEGVLQWVAPSVRRRGGWSPEELVGRTASELVDPEDRHVFADVWRRVVSGEVSQGAASYRVLHGDGASTWVRLSLTDLRDDPDVGLLVGNLVDIHGHRRERQARAAQAARLSARFHHSSTPQSTLELSGTVTEVNDAYCTLLGRPRAELVGTHFSTHLHADDAYASDRENLVRMAAGELQHLQFQRLLARGDGTAVPVLVEATVLPDASGSPESVACLLHDLSALRDAEDRRQREQDLYFALSVRASDTAAITDVDGVVVYVTGGVTHASGFQVEEVIGTDRWGFTHPDDLERGPRDLRRRRARRRQRDVPGARPRRRRVVALDRGDADQPARHRCGRHDQQPARRDGAGPRRRGAA